MWAAAFQWEAGREAARLGASRLIQYVYSSVTDESRAQSKGPYLQTQSNRQSPTHRNAATRTHKHYILFCVQMFFGQDSDLDVDVLDHTHTHTHTEG